MKAREGPYVAPQDDVSQDDPRATGTPKQASAAHSPANTRDRRRRERPSRSREQQGVRLPSSSVTGIHWEQLRRGQLGRRLALAASVASPSSGPVDDNSAPEDAGFGRPADGWAVLNSSAPTACRKDSSPPYGSANGLSRSPTGRAGPRIVSRETQRSRPPPSTQPPASASIFAGRLSRRAPGRLHAGARMSVIATTGSTGVMRRETVPSDLPNASASPRHAPERPQSEEC